MVNEMIPGRRPGHRRYKFDNGYGASVINDGYGSEKGLFELGVLGPDDRLTYSTPITDDVVGWLTEAEVQALLERIAALTPTDIRAEEARRKRAEIDAKREAIKKLEAEIDAIESEIAS